MVVAWQAVGMDFTVDQHFDAPLAEVLALYSDPEFFTALPPTDRLATPVLVSVTRTDTTIELALRHRLTAELPAMVAKFVDTEKLTWVEATTLLLTDGRSSSTLVPD